MSPAFPGRLRRARRSSLVVACAGLCAISAPAVVAEGSSANLAANPSFEASTAGWAASGGVLSRVSAADAPAGRRVARLVRRSGGGEMSLADAGVHAGPVPGRAYRAEAWVRADAPGSLGALAVISVIQRSASGRIIGRWTSAPVTLGHRFRRVAISARPALPAGRLDLRITQRRAARGDAIAVDAASLVEAGASARLSAADGVGINGSFETGTGGWNGYSATLSQVAQAGAPDGSYVVKVARSGSGSSYVLQESTPVGPLAAGVRYTAGIRVKAGSTSSVGRPIQIKLREWNAAGSVVADTASASTALATTWKRITVSATTKTAGGTLDLRVSQSSAAAGDVFFADDATMSEVTSAPPPPPAPAPAPAPAPPPAPGFDGGLLANASFEGATTGWTGYGAVVASVAAAAAPDGAYAIRVTNTSTLGYFTLNPSASTVPSTTAGTAYAAEAWAKAASASSVGKPLQLKLRERTPAGVVAGDTSSPSLTLSNTWQRLAVSRTAAGTGNALDIRVSQSGAGSGDSFLVDAIRLTTAAPTPTPTPTPTPAPPPSADTTGPTLSVSSPSADASVSGTVSIAVAATDPSAVARIEFRIDGTLAATDTSSPYATSWDTTTAAAGAHALAVTAVDTLGNATTVTRSVTVDNSAPLPAPPPSLGGGLFANPWPNAGVRQAIPADEPTDPGSASMVSAFMGVSKYIGGSNSPTRLQGGPGDPIYTGIDGTRVYIHGTPAGGGGADDTMEVFNAVAPDGSTNLVTRYWTASSLTFSGGAIGSSTTGSARIDGDGAPFRGNGTAWGLFSSVGVVLNEELAAGVIPHAVGVALGNNILSRSFRAPARSSESKAYGTTVPMGARFQITMPWEQIDATLRARFSGETLRAALVFWRAVKDYGAIIRDGTGTNGSWWYTDATGMPPGIDWSGIVRVPTFWNAANWRVPARSAY